MKSSAILATLLAAACASAQDVPIPNRLDGFRPSAHSNRSALLLLEAHYDFMCPDSRAVSKVLDQVRTYFT